MTDAEVKVWHLYIDEVAESVQKDLTENESQYINNATRASLMIEHTVQLISFQWKAKLKLQPEFNIPFDSVDEFVDVMEFNAIRKLNNALFE